MIKVTALALFIALCNAESEGHGPSRLLLQAGAPQNPVGVQPAPYNPGYPQQPQAQYNPFQNMFQNPLCMQNPQDCFEMMMQNPYYMQQYMNPYQHYNPYQQPYYTPYQNVPSVPPPQPQQPVAPAPPQQPQVQSPPVAPVDPVPPVSPPPPATPVDPALVSPPLTPPPPPSVVQPQAPNSGFNPGFNPGLVPGGMIPGMPGIYTPPVTDINCGPMPPATLCANRRNGPGGAIDPISGLPLGPLNLGANMANNAKLYCDTPGACAGSDINIDLRPNPALPQGVRAINQLLFSEPGAGQGTTVNIKNLQGNGNNVELSNLECGTASCNGLTLNGWGVSLNDVNCAVPSDCMGCMFRNMKTMPDMFCPDPYAPGATNNPQCAIEVTPCYGY